MKTIFSAILFTFIAFSFTATAESTESRRLAISQAAERITVLSKELELESDARKRYDIRLEIREEFEKMDELILNSLSEN